MPAEIFTPEQIEQFRAETPGCSHVIHFNNAGSSLPANVVLQAITDYLRDEALMGGYEAEYVYRDALQETYSLIGRLINADPSEIALVENASNGWCIAFHGIAFQPGDEVIISELEYVTNMIGVLNAKELYGIGLKVIPNDGQGNFSLDTLEAAINPRTRIIAVTHVASTTGGVLPVEAIGQIAARHNILYLLDACQSVGQMPVDVKAIGCDFLAVTGRKYLRAPRGTGFLYVCKSAQDKIRPLFIDGHSINSIDETGYQPRSDARRFEFYEKNRAITLGLTKAVEYALNIGINSIWQRISHLAAAMREQLGQIPGVTIHDIGDIRCGIVTFSVEGMDAAAVKRQLAEQKINVSVGQAKSTLLFMNKHRLQSVVRASVHYYNTLQEIEKLCTAIAAASTESPAMVASA